MAGASDIKAGKAYVELSLKNNNFVRALGQSRQQLKDFGGVAMGIGAAITGAGLAIQAALSAAVARFAQSGEELDKMSKRTGVAATTLSELTFAAEQSGQSAEVLEGSLKKMQKTLGSAFEGNKEATESLLRLGITLNQLRGKSPDQQFEAIAEAIAKVNDPTMRAALAMQIFGKSGTALIPMMGNIKALRKEAQDFHLVKSDSDIKAGAQLFESFHLLQRVIGSVVDAVGGALAPAMQTIVDTATHVGVTIGDWVKAHRQLISTISQVATGLIVGGTAITAFGFAMKIAGTSFGTFGKIFGVVKAGLTVVMGLFSALLNPVGLVAAAIGVGVYAWLRFTESGQRASSKIMGVLKSIGRTFGDTFSGIKNALAAGDLSLAASIALAGLKVAFLQGIVGIADAVGGSFGDFLGTLASQISSGDFSKAWSTVLTGMASLFDTFSQSIVSAFAWAINKIIDGLEWVDNKAQEIINRANPDFAAEQQRAEEIQEKQITQLRSAREQRQKDLETADANGGTITHTGLHTAQGTALPDVVEKSQDISNEIAAIDSRLAHLRNNPADVYKDAHEQFGSDHAFLEGGRSAVAAVKAQADANAQQGGAAFHAATAGGSDAAKKALADAQGNLDTLNKQAAAAAAKVKAEDEKRRKELTDKTGEDGEKLNGLQRAPIGAYSAAALIAAGSGGNSNPAAKTAAAAAKTAKYTQAMEKHLADQGKRIENIEGILGQGLVTT